MNKSLLVHSFVLWIFILISVQFIICEQMNIGILVDPSTNVTALSAKLDSGTMQSVNVRMAALTTDPVQNLEIVCNLVTTANPLAVIGPFQSSQILTGIHPIMKQFGLPHVVFNTQRVNMESPFLLDVLPSPGQTSRVVISLLNQFSWPYLTVITDSSHGSIGLIESLLSESSEIRVKVTMYKLSNPNNDTYSILKAVDKAPSRVVLLSSECDLTLQVLRSADASGMLTQGWVWIVLDDGVQCLDQNEVSYDGLIGIVPVYKNSQVNTQLSKTELGFDQFALSLVKQAGQSAPGIDASPKLACSDVTNQRNSSWFIDNYNKIKSTEYPGKYYYTNYRNNGWKKIGVWQTSEGYGSSSSSYVLFPGGAETVPGFVISLRGKHVWACTHVDSEEGGWKTIWKGTPPAAGDRDVIPHGKIAGFQAALFTKLSTMIGFNFTWRYPRDGQWGGQDKITMQWNGILRELKDKRCDIGAATLTLTQVRHKDFDFTMGYFETGLSFIMRKSSVEPNAFRFFEPFAPQLWYQLLLALTLAGLMLGLINKISPYEYHGEFIQAFHDMQRAVETRPLQKTFRKWYKDATHELSFANSQWFAWCSLFQQGGHYPMSLSGRVVALCWWLAVLIFTATYTANMAALFTSEVLTDKIDSIRDLAQSTVQYGTQGSSGAESFFKSSTVSVYKQMYEYMQRNKATVLIKLRQGIDKATNSKYAFIWDKAVLDWESLQEPCKLEVIGDSFNKIIYGYALRKGSPYTKELNRYILELKEKGFMDQIYKEWFYDRAECNVTNNEKSMGGLERYTFWNMSGVFLIMYALILLSCFILVAEWIVSSYQALHKMKEANLHSLWEGIKYRFGRVNRDVHLYYVPDRMKKSNDKTFKSRANVIKKIISVSKTIDEPRVGFSNVVGGAMLTHLASELRRQNKDKKQENSQSKDALADAAERPQTHRYQTPRSIEQRFAIPKNKANKVADRSIEPARKKMNVFTTKNHRSSNKEASPPSYDAIISSATPVAVPRAEALPAAIMEESSGGGSGQPPGSSMWQKFNAP